MHLATPLLVLSALLPGRGDGAVLAEARAALAADRPGDAASALDPLVRTGADGAEVLALYGEALEELDRPDEAAHYLALALRADPPPDGRTRTAIEGRLRRVDPFARDRQRFLAEAVGRLARIADALAEEGHDERALALVERLLPRADGRVRARLASLEADLRAHDAEVELDPGAGGAPEDPAAPSTVTRESEHYRLECDLEPDVVERLGATMDRVFENYVAICLDGDAGRAGGRKATIRVHPDRASMLAEWTGAGAAPAGWWSPGDWRVTCYDTRSDQGSLDPMLETLFHEASHQFTSILTSRGGRVPAWLNEGTATFFEGTRAMADGRVLWPTVARSRLLSLVAMLRDGSGPTLADVIGYDGAGSYAPEYYPFGWGLVYFLQEYEDPTTLQHSWRPVYARLLEETVTRGGDPRALFDAIVLGKDAPGGFVDLDAFAAAWRAWILDEVLPASAPVAQGDLRRSRHAARLERYVAAADRAAGDRHAPVPEAELCERALAEVATLRALGPAPAGASAPSDDALEARLPLLEADLLERVGRTESAAAALEHALALADAGELALDEETRASLEARMARLDRRAAPVRRLRLETERLRARAQRMIARYESDGGWFLRGESLAREASELLDHDPALADAARALHARALAAGRIPSRIEAVEGEHWISVLHGPEQRFEHEAGSVALAIPGRVAGRICLDHVFHPPYTVRATLLREGETFPSSLHAVVVAAAPEHDWYAVGVAGGRRLVLARLALDSGGGATLRTLSSTDLPAAVAARDDLDLAVEVDPAGRLLVRLGEDSGASPFPFPLPGPAPEAASVGVLAKDASVRLVDLRVEYIP